jgi:hypothetical protein
VVQVSASDNPSISIVVATVDARRSVSDCLRAIVAQCAAHAAEVLVVDASTDDTASIVSREFPDVPLVRLPAGTLTPVLWTTGAARARGTVIVFTTGHCTPRPGWLAALRNGMRAGVQGVGGPMVLATGTTPVDWAIYYLRYSAFTPETIGPAGVTEREIAGDNAAYCRGVLGRHPALVANGFWEVDVHRAIRRDGHAVAVAPEAVAEFGPSFPLATILRHRFAHGRHFGRGRVACGARRRWQIAAAAPIVPALLAVRTLGRVGGVPAHLWRFAVALPLYLLIASAWAAGEVFGGWKAGSRGDPGGATVA